MKYALLIYEKPGALDGISEDERAVDVRRVHGARRRLPLPRRRPAAAGGRPRRRSACRTATR